MHEKEDENIKDGKDWEGRVKKGGSGGNHSGQGGGGNGVHGGYGPRVW